MWTSEHAKPGPPAPGIFSSNFDFETILTITDDYQSLERFEVYQDDQFIGKTSERGPGSTARNDVKDADEALRLGYSQGYFTIPPGQLLTAPSIQRKAALIIESHIRSTHIYRHLARSGK